MSDTDEIYICNLCGEAFERWQPATCHNPGRCKKCTNVKARKKLGILNTKVCPGCDTTFDAGYGQDSCRRYCSECIGMSPWERRRLYAIKHGLPYAPERRTPKKVVDNTRYKCVHSIMHEPAEKVIAMLSDRRVRLVW